MTEGTYAQRKGVVLSAEALMAALLLFGALALAFGPLAPDSALPDGNRPVLRHAAYDALEAGVENRAWLEPLQALPNDLKIRNLVENLSPAVCLEVEIYQDGQVPPNLTYAYVRSGCAPGYGVEEAQGWRAIINRTDSSDYSYYWVRAIAYPRGGE